MATVHANAPADALVRLEVMAMMAAPGLSVSAARRQVASAIELVIHIRRDEDGRRRVADVAEVRLDDRGPVVRKTTTRRPQIASPRPAR